MKIQAFESVLNKYIPLEDFTILCNSFGVYFNLEEIDLDEDEYEEFLETNIIKWFQLGAIAEDQYLVISFKIINGKIKLLKYWIES